MTKWPFFPLFWVILSGCAHVATGMIAPVPSGTILKEPHGGHVRLVLGPQAQPLAELHDHFVQVTGLRGLGAIRVESWSVIEGPHSLPVWVGRLEVLGARVGLHDQSSGGFYVLDQNTGKQLLNHGGEWVVVEGYVDGPHEIHAMFYRLLDPSL